MTKLIIQSGGNSIPKEIKWGITHIGRGLENDLNIEDPSVSHRHCEIEIGIDFVLLRDCGSTNGTFVGGLPIQQARLETGQKLRFGQVEAVIEYSPESISVPLLEGEKAPESVALSDGTMSCLNHPGTRAVWRCTHCLKIFCEVCIHGLRFKGGRSHKLCPHCSHESDLIVWDDSKPKKKSLWVHLKNLLNQ
jgi:pSer/pThr/pTyr-binding forkhead associated (FHA) protein